MRALELNFAAPRTASPKGWALLSLGLVAVLLCGLAQQFVVSDPAIAGRGISPASAAVRGGEEGSADPLQSPEELRRSRTMLAEIRSISQQVNRPWERLFVSMESLSLADVALLSLVTDGHNRQLRIQAEARDLAAMLNFHEQLESSEELSDTYLTNHEVIDQAAGEPVRFNLLVTWSGSHAPL